METVRNFVIRDPQASDDKALRKLFRAAHPGMPEQQLRRLSHATRAEKHVDGKFNSGTVVNNRTGEETEFSSLGILKVAAPAGKHAQSMVYSVPPLYWIMSQNRIEPKHRQLLALRLTEIELIATDPRYQGRGMASALLTYCENTFAKAGYTCATITTTPHTDAHALDWYERRGYVMAPPGAHPVVYPWAAKDDITLPYTHVRAENRIGFKPLAPCVTVTRTGGAVTVKGILDTPIPGLFAQGTPQ